MRTKHRAMTALVAVAAAAATVPAAAGAATVTFTGDAGQPVPLNPAAPTTLRQMNGELAVALAAPEVRYSVSVAGPVAAASSPRTCSTSTGPSFVDYQGNGTYTVTVTTYTNTLCTAGAKRAVYPVVIAAGSALSQPPKVLLTRKPNDFATLTYPIPIALNPGALTHDVRLAKNATIGPDGGIAGPSQQLFAEKQTGTVSLRESEPGRYTMVARPQGFSGAAGQFFAPWSAPITFRLISPFDFISSPSFPDSKGPSYKLRGALRETATRGKVRISLAAGRKGGKFRSIGKARVRRGVFKKRFTVSNPGTYRIKYAFKGSGTTAPGTIVQRVKIRRRFF